MNSVVVLLERLKTDEIGHTLFIDSDRGDLTRSVGALLDDFGPVLEAAANLGGSQILLVTEDAH